MAREETVGAVRREKTLDDEDDVVVWGGASFAFLLVAAGGRDEVDARRNDDPLAALAVDVRVGFVVEARRDSVPLVDLLRREVEVEVAGFLAGCGKGATGDAAVVWAAGA